MSNDKLEQARNEYLDKLKKVALLDAGVSFSDVDIYVKYLKADDEAEIEQEAAEIVADIKQQNTVTDVYHDETAWKPFG